MRKMLLTTAAIALASMIAGASAAQAAVVRDGTTGQVCPAVTLSGNTVTGGCLIQHVEGMLGLFDAQGNGFDSCSTSLNLRMDGSGLAYAVNQYVICNWPITQCKDSITGQTIPWLAQNHSMPICLQAESGGPHSWTPVTWASQLGPNGELMAVYQNSTSQPIRGTLTNYLGYNEVRITAN